MDDTRRFNSMRFKSVPYLSYQTRPYTPGAKAIKKFLLRVFDKKLDSFTTQDKYFLLWNGLTFHIILHKIWMVRLGPGRIISKAAKDDAIAENCEILFWKVARK